MNKVTLRGNRFYLDDSDHDSITIVELQERLSNPSMNCIEKFYIFGHFEEDRLDNNNRNGAHINPTVKTSYLLRQLLNTAKIHTIYLTNDFLAPGNDWAIEFADQMVISAAQNPDVQQFEIRDAAHPSMYLGILNHTGNKPVKLAILNDTIYDRSRPRRYYRVAQEAWNMHLRRLSQRILNVTEIEIGKHERYGDFYPDALLEQFTLRRGPATLHTLQLILPVSSPILATFLQSPAARAITTLYLQDFDFIYLENDVLHALSQHESITSLRILFDIIEPDPFQCESLVNAVTSSPSIRNLQMHARREYVEVPVAGLNNPKIKNLSLDYIKFDTFQITNLLRNNSSLIELKIEDCRHPTASTMDEFLEFLNAIQTALESNKSLENAHFDIEFEYPRSEAVSNRLRALNSAADRVCFQNILDRQVEALDPFSNSMYQLKQRLAEMQQKCPNSQRHRLPEANEWITREFLWRVKPLVLARALLPRRPTPNENNDNHDGQAE